MTTQKMAGRNKSIDILKGIGISLVLVAHSLEGFVSQFAYTFHMPLFFIVTGLFISVPPIDDCASYKAKVVKDFKRLLVPALFTIAVILMISGFCFVKQDSYLKHPISLIWNANPAKVIDYIILPGNLWFLFALFWGKQCFYFLANVFKGSSLPLVCLLIGGISVAIGRYFLLPVDVLQGVSAVPFIWVGYYLKEHGGVDRAIMRWFYLAVVIWIVYVFYGKLHIAFMEYRWYYYPDIIAACGGTLLFYRVSTIISEKTRYINQIFAFLGVYSLVLICAPTIETYCFPFHEILPEMAYRKLFVIVAKVGWCAFALFACIKIPFLRSIFGIKLLLQSK